MNTKNYNQLIHEAKTLEGLEKIKQEFIAECEKKANNISTEMLVEKIKNFGSAKSMFESITPLLLSKKGGKRIINNYINVIKENKSLKTTYGYIVGLEENENVESKKNFITEALSISEKINKDEYNRGVNEIKTIIKEAFKILGDEVILKNVKFDDKSEMIPESLYNLSISSKKVSNLNEYFNNIDIVSGVITESKKDNINIDLSLKDIVNEMIENKTKTIDDVLTSENKEKSFSQLKENCMKLISIQKNNTNDNEIIFKLNEMENKLKNKHYTYETYTKDVLYMTELQEVLK